MIQQETMIPVLELAQEQLENYMPSLLQAVDRGCKEIEGSFYVKVLVSHDEIMVHDEKLDQEVPMSKSRFLFYTQKLCPYPDYDQTIFRYNRKKDQVEFVWSLPDEETARMLIANREKVVEEEKELLNFVVAFAVGKLRELCERWNATPEEPLVEDNCILIH